MPYPAEFAARYIARGYWRPETIPQAVAAAAARHGTAPVSDPDRRLDTSELVKEAAALAGSLAEHGLWAGDRIIIQLPNCLEFLSLFLACLEMGVIPVMALPAFRRTELEYLVKFSGARAIAVAKEYRGFDYASMACELRRAVPGLDLVLTLGAAEDCVDLSGARRFARRIGTRARDAYDVALFLLSGGTTGLPKLIPRTHADYLYNAREAAKICGLAPGSRILLALPVEHNFPLAAPGLLGALLAGAHVVLMQSTQATEIAAAIERERITHFPCVPTIAQTLLDLPERGRFDLSSLRVITAGGARLPTEVAFRLRRELPGVRVQQVFGMAEGLICYTRLDDPEEIACCTQGRPLSPADELRVVDSSGREQAPGSTGELWCRGPYTIRGYYRAPERNREAFSPDGFYKTGDLVRRDGAGNVIVEGRIKDLINRGGEKISAEEIENHILAHPAVAAAAVVAMPDALLGERCCAYVVFKPGERLELAGLRDFLERRELARFKWPERLEPVAQLPLTAVGKVNKVALRGDIEARLGNERASAATVQRHCG